MTEWIIEIDMPTDRPWFYRVPEDRLVEALEAFATLNKRVLAVRPIGAPRP